MMGQPVNVLAAQAGDLTQFPEATIEEQAPESRPLNSMQVSRCVPNSCLGSFHGW